MRRDIRKIRLGPTKKHCPKCHMRLPYGPNVKKHQCLTDLHKTFKEDRIRFYTSPEQDRRSGLPERREGKEEPYELRSANCNEFFVKHPDHDDLIRDNRSRPSIDRRNHE